MIRKLRKKFILINMLLVGIVLLAVFSVICLSNYRQLAGQTRMAMDRALSRGAQMQPQKFEMGGRKDQPLSIVPVCCAELDRNGTITAFSGDRVSISEDTLTLAVQAALKSSQTQGHIPSLKLRFLKAENDGGTRIAFADYSYEVESMTSLLLTLLAVGLGGLAAFYLINLFLSRWALKPAERVWAQQRQFVADASHELKTPLTVILANSQILLSHPDSTLSEQQKWVENTRTEALRMKKLVDEMLFLAKADDSRAEVPFTLFSLSDTIQHCVLPFEPVAFEQGVTLESQVPSDIMLFGNEAQIKQLVIILLDNGCKYAGAQGKVTLLLVRDQERIQLSVHNTGEPIPPKHLPHLFERFYRVDESRARTQGGYGLGLAIAQSIAHLHRTNITVESDSVKGTTFAVAFKVKP